MLLAGKSSYSVICIYIGMVLKIVPNRKVNPLIFGDHGATITTRVGDNTELVIWANTTCTE